MLAQPIYIRNAVSVHPSVEANQDYKKMIPAPVLRRMSRIVRMGVAAALECLEPYHDIRPDAILTATGLGCLNDTEKFMNNLIDMNEELLPPTPFIQSTFNTIGAQIAQLTENHCYNNTYVHRAFSFESALIDASLLMKEGEAHHILAGAVDEQNQAAFRILERMGCWRKARAGEGAAFFLLANKPEDKPATLIQNIELFSGSYTQDEKEKRAQEFLAANDACDATIIRPHTYKLLCGEYPTAIAFALWHITCHQPIANNVLLCNSFLNNHSLILVKHLRP